MTTKSAYIEAPRGLDVNEFLYRLADNKALELTITTIENGLFTKTIHYKVTGELLNIKEFFSSLSKAVNKLN